MNSLLRPAMLVVIAIPLAVCVFGLRFASDSEDIRWLIRELRLNEVWSQKSRDSWHRFEAREETVRALIAQRCSLKEAMARFQELDGEHPVSIQEEARAERANRNLSDAEYSYQCIVLLAKDLLKDRPEEEAAVLRRLEKEYQQLRDKRQVPLAMPAKPKESIP